MNNLMRFVCLIFEYYKAAHCVVNFDNVFATFNDFSMSDVENGEKTVETNQIFIHEDYFDDPNVLTFMDIALLKFDEDLLSFAGTAKACLATGYPEGKFIKSF